MPTHDSLRSFAATCLVLSVVASVVAVGGIGVARSASSADASTSSLAHGAEFGNYTVYFPESHDQYPRSENPDGTHSTTVHHYAGFTPEAFEKAGTPKGTENLSWIWIESQEIDFSQCTTPDTRAFGIDRDGDDPNTETDVSLLTYREDTDFNDNSIYVDFYEGNEDFGPPPREDKGGEGQGPGEGREDGDKNAEVYPDDEIIAVQEECYGMPEEPGWYQINAGGNGTGFNGKTGTIVQTSHYFYVCKCDDEQQARQTLGPPPSERNGGGGNDDVTETPTASTPASSTGNETSPTPTPSPTGPGDQPSPTADTPTSPTSTATTATTGPGDDQRQETAGENETPAQNQPGFGALAAILALAGAAYLGVRRRR